MAPTDGVDPDGGRATAPLARRHVIALTIAGAGLAGVVGGFAAFGVAHAVSGDDTSLTASGHQTSQTSTPQPRASSPATLAPDTVTVTPTPTKDRDDDTTTTSSPRGGSGSGSGSDGSGTRGGRGTDGDSDAAAAVLPERVLPTLTTTPGDEKDDRGGAEGADGAGVRQAGTGGGDRSETTTPSPGDRDRDADAAEDDKARGDEPTTTVPTDGDRGGNRGEDADRTEGGRDGEGRGDEDPGRGAEPAPDRGTGLLSDRAPLTAARIDGAFRNALAPGVPADQRDTLFEGGAEARPLTDRLASLSTGSVPLLHWSVHEPVMYDGDRATVRVRSDVLFNLAWRPVTFVNVDGDWKMTRESTCELSASLLLPCA